MGNTPVIENQNRLLLSIPRCDLDNPDIYTKFILNNLYVRYALVKIGLTTQTTVSIYLHNFFGWNETNAKFRMLQTTSKSLYYGVEQCFSEVTQFFTDYSHCDYERIYYLSDTEVVLVYIPTHLITTLGNSSSMIPAKEDDRFLLTSVKKQLWLINRIFSSYEPHLPPELLEIVALSSIDTKKSHPWLVHKPFGRLGNLETL